jgi:hypothetical protein
MSIISWTSPHQLRRGFADGYQPAKIIFRRAQFLGEQLCQFAVGVRAQRAILERPVAQFDPADYFASDRHVGATLAKALVPCFNS